MKLKRYVICILLLGFLLSFTGCNASEKIKYISKEELAACSNGVMELNKENWEQFFTTKQGDLVEKKTSGYRGKKREEFLVLKPECVMLSEKAELSLQGKKKTESVTTFLDTQETETGYQDGVEFAVDVVFTRSEMQTPLMEREYERDGGMYVQVENEEYREMSLKRKTDLLSLECIDASGQMMTWNIPEEFWNVEEEGVRFICIGDKNVYFRVYELTFHYDMVRYLEKYGEVE